MPLHGLQRRCRDAAWTLRLLPLCRLSSSSSFTRSNRDLSSIALTAEEEASSARIKSSLFKARKGSVEDLVRSLGAECSEIRLTSSIADSLLCRFGDDWKSALGFFQWAQSRGGGYAHTPYACNRMVDLLGKMRQIDRMWDLLSDMHCRGMVTVETVAKSIRRLAGARRWKDAIVLFDKLEDMGLERNTETMNVLLDALCKEKKIELAREVFAVLSPHIAADAYTFNIFVHGWCSMHKIDEAMWTIEEMKSRGFPPTVITYTAVLEAYCKQRNFRRVYEVLDSMCSQGCHPNVITYTMIMTSLAKCERFEEALSVSHRMKSSGCNPDTLFYNSLINLLGKAGHLFEASQVFRVEMPRNDVPRNLVTYNTMISILCHYGRDDDALSVLKEMEAQSCKPDLQTYQPLLRLFLSRRGRGDDVHRVLSELINKSGLGLDLDTYTLLIHGLCRVGEIDWAYRLYDEMVGSEIMPRHKTCELLLSEAQRKNMEACVERVRNDMICFGLSP
ncbi:pentatricopeptide repeat-containing protein At3g04130, mitochondrial [Phragmites australis]|uniref:pentatricopeptide repeat-containing protein At3g04130, mitochondrial n=1 Tax=Phragmites australis TaxID=29695 RepID=UPI002D78015D|nr:pentatricopeptide repeat-containing protein At3g04130, mitochondrial [Phragmites australis]